MFTCISFISHLQKTPKQTRVFTKHRQKFSDDFPHRLAPFPLEHRRRHYKSSSQVAGFRIYKTSQHTPPRNRTHMHTRPRNDFHNVHKSNKLMGSVERGVTLICRRLPNLSRVENVPAINFMGYWRAFPDYLSFLYFHDYSRGRCP